MTCLRQVAKAIAFVALATLLSSAAVAPVGAETIEQFKKRAPGDVDTTQYTVRSVRDIKQQLAQLHLPETVPGDYALMSTEEKFYLDQPLEVAPVLEGIYFTITLFFGVLHKPQQRLQLVCRNASTALIIRTPVAIGNLDISNFRDSAVVVDMPTAEYQVTMLYFGLHHNSGQSGAGVKLVTGGTTLNYIDMSHNTASENGAGLFVGKNACVQFDQRQANDSEYRFRFAHNQVQGKGGAIYWDHPNCTFDSDMTYDLHVRDATFSNNTAQQAGGAVFVIHGSQVLQEYTQRYYDLQMKAVDIGFVHTHFSSNKVLEGTGGAVHVAQLQGILTLEDVQFIANTAASGGALWAASSLHGKVNISSSSFTANKAGPAMPQLQPVTNLGGAAVARAGAGYGGAMYLTGSLEATFQRGTGTSFKGNSAVAEGGAIHCAFCSSLLVSGVAFEDNTAAAGGAVCMDRVSLSSLINDNHFAGNAAACPGTLQAESSSSVAASAAAAGAGAAGYTCGCGGGGAVCIRSASSVELSGNAFMNNTGYAGGALYINQDDCLLPVKPPCSVRVVKHTFTSNVAAAAGGAIYLTAPFQSTVPVANLIPSPDSIASYPDSRFEPPPHTSACASVLNAHTTSFRPSPTVPSVDVLNNLTNNAIRGSPHSAGYGPDIATAVACMLRANTLAPPTTAGSRSVREVTQPQVVTASGEAFPVLLRSYDAYGQLISRPLAHVAYTVATTATSSEDSGMSITAPTQTVFNPVLRCLEVQNLSLFSTNYTSYNLTVSAVVSSLQSVAQTVVTVQLRPCCVGQVAAGRSCKSCSSTTARNQYSFNPRNQTCDRCPKNAVCGGSTLMPMDGYWHANPRSDKLHLCPVRDSCTAPNRSATLEALQQQLLGACGQPGLDPADVRRYSQVQCRQGYEGNACGNCQADGENTYGRKGQVCSRCTSRWSSVLAFVALKLCEAAFVACLVLARTRKARRPPLPSQSSAASLQATMTSPILGRGAGTSTGSASGLRNDLSKLSAEAATYLAALLEILVVHVQVLGLLATAQIGWPPHLFSFFNALRFHEASSIWISPDCLLPKGASNVAFWRIAIITLSPSGTMMLLVVACLCFVLTRHSSSTQHHAKAVPLQTATAVAIAYSTFYYPSIVNTVLSVFTCMPLDRPGATFDGLPSIASSSYGWWKQDYDMQCFTGPHLVFSLAYGLPFLVLFAVGVPLFITYFLWRHRRKGMLADAAFQAKFGYMYTDFSSSCWFWFCVRFWLLLALSAAIQGLSYFGAARQLITVELCLSLVLLLQLGFKPYQSRLVNTVYAAMLYTVLVTVFLSSAYTTPSSTVHQGTMWVMIALNAGMVAMQLAIIAAGLVGMRTAVVGKTNAVLYNVVTRMKSAVIIGTLGAYSSIVQSHRSGGEPLAGAADSAA